MSSETDPAEPVAAEPPPVPAVASARGGSVDAVGAQLVGGFLATLVLILPLRAALGTTTYGSLYGWLFVGVGMVLLVGLLLRTAGIPYAFGVVLSSAGAFAVAVLLTMTLVASTGAPGDDTSVALLAGIPAAAVAAPVAVVVCQVAATETGAWTLGAIGCALGLLIAAGAGPSVGQNVADARQDAEWADLLEAAGVTAHLPEIDGTRVEFGSTRFTTPPGGPRTAAGYSLRYEPESAGPTDFGTYISVDVGLTDGEPVCEPISDYLTCREGDGYVVTERDGVAEEVTRDAGGTRLRAVLRESSDDLPDVDEVGRALVDAEQVEWNEIFGLD